MMDTQWLFKRIAATSVLGKYTDPISMETFTFQHERLLSDGATGCATVVCDDGRVRKETAVYLSSKWYLMSVLGEWYQTRRDLKLPFTLPHNPQYVFSDRILEKIQTEAGKDVLSIEGSILTTVVHQASQEQASKEVIALFQEAMYHALDLNTIRLKLLKHPQKTYSPLSIACEINSETCIHWLNENGYDFAQDTGCQDFYPNGILKERTSSLYLACELERHNLIDLFSTVGYDLRADLGRFEYNAEGFLTKHVSSLCVAVAYDAFEVIKSLCMAGYNISSDFGCMCFGVQMNVTTQISNLYIAAEKNASKAILILQFAGYDIQADTGFQFFDRDAQEIKTRSALCVASLNNALDSILALQKVGYCFSTDKGERVFGKTGVLCQDISSLYSAIIKNALASVKALYVAGYNFQSDTGVQLFNAEGKKIYQASSLSRAVELNDPDLMLELVSGGYNFQEDIGIKKFTNGKVTEHVSSLYIAAEHGATQAIDVFKRVNYDFSKDVGLACYIHMPLFDSTVPFTRLSSLVFFSPDSEWYTKLRMWGVKHQSLDAIFGTHMPLWPLIPSPFGVFDQWVR